MALYGTNTERAIKYAMESCARRERNMIVWRIEDRVGVTSDLPEGAKLIGTAVAVEGRAAARWEPAP